MSVPTIPTIWGTECNHNLTHDTTSITNGVSTCGISNQNQNIAIIQPSTKYHYQDWQCGGCCYSLFTQTFFYLSTRSMKIAWILLSDWYLVWHYNIYCTQPPHAEVTKLLCPHHEGTCSPHPVRVGGDTTPMIPSISTWISLGNIPESWLLLSLTGYLKLWTIIIIMQFLECWAQFSHFKTVTESALDNLQAVSLMK